jgi:FkbM family methyltransferase
MIKKIKDLISMRKNASEFGIAFKRRATFKTPEFIADGRKVCFPQEQGARNDFIGIFIDDCYRLLQIKELNRILDIGANIGFFSIAAKVKFPNALVHSYEPVIDLSDFLDPNKIEYGFSVFHEAVGGHSGYVNIQAEGDSNQARVSESEHSGIPKISIDEAIQRMDGTVDLLKIDCEGSEWEMFNEGKNWDRVARIAMEYHNFDGQPHTLISDELTRIGFDVIDQKFDPNVSFGMAYAINPNRTKWWR